MISKKQILLVIFILIISNSLYSQIKENTGFWKWTTWTLLQTIPSVSYYEDKDLNNKKFKFALEWQIIPFSYTFKANKFVSPVQFFYINPVKRFSGSVEIFFQPVIVPGGFKYTSSEMFLYKAGGRLILPVAHSGEYLAISAGGGIQYNRRSGEDIYDPTVELSVYSFFGMVGLKYNYNFNSDIKHNFGMYFKYY